MIKIQTRLSAPLKTGENFVLFVSEKSKEPIGSFLIGSVANTALDEARQEGFEGKPGQTSLIRIKSKTINKIIFVGLGSGETLQLNSIRRGTAEAARMADQLRLTDLVCRLPGVGRAQDTAQAAAEGFHLGLYQFAQFQSQPTPLSKLKNVSFLAKDNQELKEYNQGIRLGQIFAQAVIFVRDLVNFPPSEMDPQRMTQIAKSTLKKPILLRVFHKNEIKKLGMGAFLGVNRGSAKEPIFLHLIYKPTRGPVKRKIGICGKGITFDSGGLSLKPAKSMETMKDDMSGAATVIAIFNALSILKPQIEVHGFTPITENMPGGDALKPGDVVTALNGKTIEVLNTDAEGRLILSDALSYASRQNLDEVVDIATLTGACVVALGTGIAGLLGTDEKLLRRIQNAAQQAGEKLWTLPLEEEYQPLLKSNVADIKNIGPTGVAGTILAALFLKNFVDAKLPWAHLDIASTAWSEHATPLSQVGATGVMVRTLLTYLLSYQ